MLAKAGILALLLKNIKLVILAIAGIGGGAYRYFTGKKKKAEDEMTRAPEPAEAPHL